MSYAPQEKSTFSHEKKCSIFIRIQPKSLDRRAALPYPVLCLPSTLPHSSWFYQCFLWQVSWLRIVACIPAFPYCFCNTVA
ncbi:hypothetical protein HMPREF0083_04113 [Aneurinibacillus aneurinilyticus ATCC 12856]|uniref:Uncharacterized protein n=1 Tax=Aneurinibacillus aneurinilyticus ATCC 12856 TaxID=649747 RepID=U1YAN6_ANEAE|nr:hypothetical protein HMPREF0083_04113 [Aneurinibacillus aneurinilyticus ATCC 12856]